jgi:phage shock protein A
VYLDECRVHPVDLSRATRGTKLQQILAGVANDPNRILDLSSQVHALHKSVTELRRQVKDIEQKVAEIEEWKAGACARIAMSEKMVKLV